MPAFDWLQRKGSAPIPEAGPKPLRVYDYEMQVVRAGEGNVRPESVQAVLYAQVHGAVQGIGVMMSKDRCDICGRADSTVVTWTSDSVKRCSSCSMNERKARRSHILTHRRGSE